MAPPVEKDQELELRIDSLAYGGNGVARLNGFALGTWQGIFFCEFDGPRRRKVFVTPLR